MSNVRDRIKSVCFEIVIIVDFSVGTGQFSEGVKWLLRV
jgi:hypothetical protein